MAAASVKAPELLAESQMRQLDNQVDLWFAKDARQRVMWHSVVRLSLDYFESLTLPCHVHNRR